MKPLIKYVFILLVFISCKKDNEAKQKIEPILHLDYVVSGIKDTLCINYIFNPVKEIYEKETGCLTYKGFDSIDINNDTKYDFKFETNHQVPDIANICNSCPKNMDCFPSGHKSKISYILDSSFQIACSDNYNILCFSAGDTINKNFIWKNNGAKVLIDSTYFPLPSTAEGFWIYSEDKYIGIRKIGNDTIYGWIKANTRYNIQIKEVYLNIKK